MGSNQNKDITMQQIEALISLIEQGSFSRAARKMRLTQPAITKHIHNMEDALGVRIVNRSNMGISLTPEGQIFYEYAKKIIKIRNESKDRIARLSQNNSGDIYLCASTIPATYILPAVLSGFRKKHPDIRIHMKASDSEETLNRVLVNQAEIGFIGKEPANRKIVSEPLWKDRLVLAVPPAHPLLKHTPVPLARLRTEPFIIRERGSATREIFETFLRERSIDLSSFNIVGELGSSEAVKEAILSGLGISMISIHAIRRELERQSLLELPVEHCRIERNLYLIYRRQFDLMPCHETFFEFVRNHKT